MTNKQKAHLQIDTDLLINAMNRGEKVGDIIDTWLKKWRPEQRKK